MNLPPQVAPVPRTTTNVPTAIPQEGSTPSGSRRCMAGQHLCGTEPTTWCCRDGDACGTNGTCDV